MKAIYTLALITAGVVFTNSTPLRASAVDGRIEVSFNKLHSAPLHLKSDEIKLSKTSSAQVNERTGFHFQDEVGEWLTPQVKADPGAQGGTNFSPMLEAPKPDDVVRSETHPSLEYSGILVQAVRTNPFQLFNPFAPVRYGDGGANTVRNVTTGRFEGLKILSIHF